MEYGYPQLQNNLEVCMFHTTVFDIEKKASEICFKMGFEWVFIKICYKFLCLKIVILEFGIKNEMLCQYLLSVFIWTFNNSSKHKEWF